VLALCADAGLVDVAVLAVDGTKIYAGASRDATRDYDQIAAEVLAEADAVDRAEDEQFGAARGDELPAHLSTHQGRRGWLRDAKRALDERRAKEAKSIPSSRRIGCARGSGGWRRSTRPSAARTPTTRPIARAG
jgi:hypothetical protein